MYMALFQIMEAGAGVSRLPTGAFKASHLEIRYDGCRRHAKPYTNVYNYVSQEDQDLIALVWGKEVLKFPLDNSVKIVVFLGAR